MAAFGRKVSFGTHFISLAISENFSSISPTGFELRTAFERQAGLLQSGTFSVGKLAVAVLREELPVGPCRMGSRRQGR